MLSIHAKALILQRKFLFTKNIYRHFSLCTALRESEKPIPTSSRVVIAGGGVTGCSVAYHLAKKGITDVVLLEQGQLTCGTTWHAAGLIGQLRGTAIESKLSSYGRNLYVDLEKELGISWKECGSLYLARTSSRMTFYKRAFVDAQTRNIHAEILSPSELNEKCSILNPEGLIGGVWVPSDGVLSPSDLTMAYAKKAKELGLKIIENVKVQEILTKSNKVSGVITDKGQIDCETFVNCTGQWARFLGEKSSPNVRIPLHSCEHFYIVTKPFDVEPMMPVIRDYDGYIYAREWSGGLLGGCFELEAKPCFHDAIPDNFEFGLLQEDWDHFGPILEQLLLRFPSLQTAQVRKMYNGPESFTPDGKPILGESPEIANYFIAAGMNSTGIANSGGIGDLISDWIINGDIKENILPLDCRRFVDLHNNRKFLRDRVKEIPGFHSIVGPENQFKGGRKLRTSSLYPRLTRKGMKMGQIMGFERALYFDSSDSNDNSVYDSLELPKDSFNAYGKPIWFDKVQTEYRACREGVSVIDMSTFTKFELQSKDREVVDFLQYVCANDIDREIGSVVHTGMLNYRGGFENDCSIVRLAKNRFFMVAPTTQQTRGLAWLRKHLPSDGSVQVSDVTSMYGAINLLGPKAHAVLSELTDISLSSLNFKAMTCQIMDVGQASGIIAMRLTHAGEDGWMLYVPSEYALHVYDCIMEAGRDYGIRNAGYYALRTLRTERFFAYWGTDLSPVVTPLECGREFRVKFDGADFIGKNALIKQKQEGIKKRLVQFVLTDHNVNNDIWPWGGEPIYRNNQLVGSVTSAAYGFTFQKQVCLGFVSHAKGNSTVTTDYVMDKNAKYHINIANTSFAARPSILPQKL